MLKFIFVTILVLWLSFKLAGFVIRLFLRSAGFQINARRGAGFAPRPQAQSKQAGGRQRPMTDRLDGDYVDFEEVK